MKPRKIETTPTQRKNLTILKGRFGEWGYFVFPLAKRFRRHLSDTIVVPKDTVTRSDVLIIRMERRGLISIRPFQRTGNYHHVREKLSELYKKKVVVGVYWRGGLKAGMMISPYRWDAFIRPKDLRELAALTELVER